MNACCVMAVRQLPEAAAGAALRRPRRYSYWMSFVADPRGRTWYRAHNASIVSAYLENRDLAEQENAAERFFLNVVLVRVLYAHALVSAPRLALGPLAGIGPMLGDPRLAVTGVFLSLSRIVPDQVPAEA